MTLEDIHIVLDRKFCLQFLSHLLGSISTPSTKNIRIDHCPLDKKGDIMDLVVYAFNDLGQYNLYFPKRVRLPLKFSTKEEFAAVMVNAMDKVIPACVDFLEVKDVDTAKQKATDLVPIVLNKAEESAINKLNQFDRMIVLLKKGAKDGTLDKVIKEQDEKERVARERLEAAWKEFDAMTDEQFHQIVMDNVELCNSEAYQEEMLPQWIEQGIQSDVTQTLHDAVSLIMERGPKQTPEWGKEDEKGFEEHGFHTEFHSYRGFTVRFDSCAVDSGYHLYKDGGTHLIMI